MTPFYYCKTAKLPDVRGGEPVQAAVTTAPTGGLLLSLPRNIEPPLRTPIDVVFYDPLQGIVHCRCSLSAPLVAGDRCSYRCEVLEQLSREQRREDLKISLSLKVDVSYRDGHWPSTILNISAGGVMLVSDLVAQPKDRLSFNFPKVSPPIPLTAEVLRVELYLPPYGRTAYSYGCRFVDLNAQQESQLRGYIFQEEKQLYRAH